MDFINFLFLKNLLYKIKLRRKNKILRKINLQVH